MPPADLRRFGCEHGFELQLFDFISAARASAMRSGRFTHSSGLRADSY